MIGPGFEQVLAAARANAGWAFTRLYDDVAPAVAGYLKAQGVREHEDMTSEVFLAAFSKLATFSGTETGFRSFVFTIAHRRIVDGRRAATRRPHAAPLDDVDPDRQTGVASPGTGTAEDDALARMGAERVHRILARLPPDQRDVLTLRIVADLTVDQVALALDKTPGAVKALQRRALEALRREFARQGATL
jgi:RNA polymerase sigma factor (sigma-70 family)